MKRAAAAASASVIIAIATSAWAADLDAASGKLQPDQDAALTIGLDSAASLTEGIELWALRFDQRNGALTFADSASALEGDGAWELGGDLAVGVIGLSGVAAQLDGRRVEIKFWWRPQGAELGARLRWVSGDWRTPISGAGDAETQTIGELVLLPTGRATNDGWQEVSTGPIDYSLGGRKPASYIALFDIHAASAGSVASVVRASEARMLIDAVEVLDLGPATVPNARCSLADEEPTCGAQGICHLGQCVDAAAVEGPNFLDDAWRRDYIARRVFELETFEGIRSTRMMLETVTQAMAQLGEQRGDALWWRKLAELYTRLNDGHAAPPQLRAIPALNRGVCLVRGRADLLLDGPEFAPLVADRLDATTPLASPLAIGDALVRADGLDIAQWRDRLAGRFGLLAGDSSGRDYHTTPELMTAAAASGARLEFARCAQPAGCTEAETQTITLDLFDLLAEPLWSDTPPMFRASTTPCDFRLARSVEGDDVRQVEYADWAQVGDHIEILINGFGSLLSDSGSRLATTVNNAVAEAADRGVLLDLRFGPGGSPQAMAFVVGRLADTLDTLVAELFPWFEGALDAGTREDLVDCARRNDGFGGEGCGDYVLLDPRRGLPALPVGKQPVAVMMGFAVSANDFILRFLAARNAPTRLFGPVPSLGALGLLCELPGYLDEPRPPTYQCQDSVFAASAPSADLNFEAGRGISPQETVDLLQSDAVVGRDTQLEAARAWLDAQAQEDR